MKFKPGRPPILDDELIKHILKFVPGSYVLSQVARLAKVPQQRLSEWLKKGKTDLEEGNDTIYVQFAVKYEELKGQEIKKLIEGMLSKGSWQAFHEILKSTSPDDFGKDAELYKELFADFQKLLQSVQK